MQKAPEGESSSCMLYRTIAPTVSNPERAHQPRFPHNERGNGRMAIRMTTAKLGNWIFLASERGAKFEMPNRDGAMFQSITLSSRTRKVDQFVKIVNGVEAG